MGWKTESGLCFVNKGRKSNSVSEIWIGPTWRVLSLMHMSMCHIMWLMWCKNIRRKHMLDVREAAESLPLWQRRLMRYTVHCCLALSNSPHTHPWEGGTCCRDSKKVWKVCLCREWSDAAPSLYQTWKNMSPGFNILETQKTHTHRNSHRNHK